MYSPTTGHSVRYFDIYWIFRKRERAINLLANGHKRTKNNCWAFRFPFDMALQNVQKALHQSGHHVQINLEWVSVPRLIIISIDLTHWQFVFLCEINFKTWKDSWSLSPYSKTEIWIFSHESSINCHTCFSIIIVNFILTTTIWKSFDTHRLR